jgi:5'-nucleotidase
MPPMRHRLLPLLASLALAACAEGRSPAPLTPPSPAPAPAPPPSPRCLSIVAWNDLHGQIGPDDPVIDTGRLAAGGVIALADQIEAVRATGDAVVVLDAGDLFTGPLASTTAEGAPIIEAYKLLGVDAAAIGNHDFDFGPVGYQAILAPPGVGDEAGAAGPRGALLQRMEEASFPFLSANIHLKSGAPPSWPRLRASTRITRGGFDVGVVGYTTRDAPTTTLQPNVADLDFVTGAAVSVARAVHELRAAGAAPVILLAHASIDGHLPDSLDDTAAHHGELATLLAELGPDVPDLIVAGHRHAWMLGRLRGVPIVSSDQHGVGLARARFCRDGGALALGGIEHRVAVATAPPRTELGARVLAAMAPWEAKVKALAETRVTTVTKECAAKGLNGSAMGDQVARATREHVADAAAVPPGVPVVGLGNSGALRAPLPAGEVHFGDLFTVLPFENTVAACGTTRRGLVRFIENAIKKEGARERFPFGISGAKVKLKREADGRLVMVDLAIEGEKKGAGDDAPVWIALSDFMLHGGDALLAGVTCSPMATSQTRVREAWRAVLEREKGGCEGPSPNVTVE